MATRTATPKSNTSGQKGSQVPARELPAGHEGDDERLDNGGDPSFAAQERGERVQTGKDIACGGHQSCHVPGATEEES